MWKCRKHEYVARDKKPENMGAGIRDEILICFRYSIRCLILSLLFQPGCPSIWKQKQTREKSIKMEFPSIPGASIDLNLFLAPSSNQETTHKNVVFPHSNFHIGSTSMQVANIHNEILATINCLHHCELGNSKKVWQDCNGRDQFF